MTGHDETPVGTTLVRVGLFERFTVTVNGVPTPETVWSRRTSAALVKLLALAAGRRLHREQVIDALWPDTAVDVAVPRLHKAAHYARKGLGAGRSLVLVNDTVTLLPDAEVVVDVLDFCATAEAALRSGSVDQMHAALGRYRGEPLTEDRYETWTDGIRSRVAALHDELLAKLATAPSGAVTATARPDPGTPSRLVGRRELGELLRARVASTEQGHGGTVILSGPAGVGKSAVLRAVAEIASQRGWQVGRGVASALESPWAFAPVLEAVTALGASGGSEGLHAGKSSGDGDLRALLRRELPGADEETRARLFPAVERLLRERAALAPVLLVIDDVDEADLPSLRLLHYVARRMSGQRVLLVVSYRSPPTGSCAQLRDSLVSRDLAESVEVSPLPGAATSRLVSDRFPRLRADQVAEVVAASGGLPFTALQLGRFMSGDRFTVPSPRLQGAVLRTLQCAAGLGESFGAARIAAQVGIPAAEAVRHLAVGETVSILVRTPDGHRFRHPLLRAVVAALPISMAEPVGRADGDATSPRTCAAGRLDRRLRSGPRTSLQPGRVAAVARRSVVARV